MLGPIIGGLLNTEMGMVQTCTMMGYFGATALLLYLVFAICVYFTVHQENTIALSQDSNNSQQHLNTDNPEDRCQTVDNILDLSSNVGLGRSHQMYHNETEGRLYEQRSTNTRLGGSLGQAMKGRHGG